MTILKRIWATIKKWWWAFLGAILLIVAWVFSITRKKKPLTREELLKGKTHAGVESLRQVAVIEAERAQTDILIEKAKADTKVEAKREELGKIKKDPDPVARRKRLARWAERNI